MAASQTRSDDESPFDYLTDRDSPNRRGPNDGEKRVARALQQLSAVRRVSWRSYRKTMTVKTTDAHAVLQEAHSLGADPVSCGNSTPDGELQVDLEV